jgi:hypothetical protein
VLEALIKCDAERPITTVPTAASEIARQMAGEYRLKVQTTDEMSL